MTPDPTPRHRNGGVRIQFNDAEAAAIDAARGALPRATWIREILLQAARGELPLPSRLARVRARAAGPRLNGVIARVDGEEQTALRNAAGGYPVATWGRDVLLRYLAGADAAPQVLPRHITDEPIFRTTGNTSGRQ